MTVNFATLVSNDFKENRAGQRLFEDGGKVLSCRKGRWKVVSRPEGDYDYKKIFKAILIDNYNELPEKTLLSFIERFNAVWIENRYEGKQASLKDSGQGKREKEILFNNSRYHTWMGNFFNMLLYDPKKKLLFPSIEARFAFFKFEQQPNRDERKTKELIVSLCDSKKAKKAAKKIWKSNGKEDNKKATDVMEKFVLWKFAQNSCLKDRLLATEDHKLIQFTQNTFWSRNDSLNIKGENKMGAILEATRSHFAG